MFKDLRTSTKIVILCGAFIVAIGVTTYSLIAEKQIAIDFAKKELVGTQYLTSLRGIYAGVLTGQPIEVSAAPPKQSSDEMLKALAVARGNAGARLQIGEFAQALADALRLWSTDHNDNTAYSTALNVLAAARQLISRIADESNLALDPDLDSYHLQNLITRKLPVFFRRLGELQILSRQAAAAGAPSSEQKVYFQVLQRELQSIVDEVKVEFAAAYRGNPDGSLKQAIDSTFSQMRSYIDAFHDSLHARFAEDDVAGRNVANSNRLYGDVVESATAAWAAAQSELDRLVQLRIDGFVKRMRWSVALTGALVGLSILVSVMTYRHIVEPLERLESVAAAVRKTKDYSLRIDYTAKSEIGQLATGFNDMLSELEAARERERSQQTEIAHVSRLSIMGTVTASIAHEIKQPLQAIAANSNAAQRWLSREKPNLEEASLALESIAKDTHRASEVIESMRRVLKKGDLERERVPINDVVEDILVLFQGDLRKHRVSVQIDLLQTLPNVMADRTQLQLVLGNLTMNAVDAMKSVSNQERLLLLKSNLDGSGNVTVTVEDSGPGIDPDHLERIFDPFFTTKSEGMGLGLAICRSIIEAHGGRLWASLGGSRGALFHVALPSAEA
jgi:signal transduction histidine kinase